MPATVDDYLASLPDDRRAALAIVRATINANLPAGYEEGIQYGMISWYVPLSVYPDTYNKQALALACLGAKKSYMVLHAMSAYGDPAIDTWFRKAYADSGKKLDMGAGCVRFKKLEALPLDVVGQLIAKLPPDRYIAAVEASRASRLKANETARTAKKSAPAKKATAKKATAKKATAKKPTAKKPTAKKPAKKATKKASAKRK